MNEAIFLILAVVLVFMIYQNIRLFKRSKHVKSYIKCSDAIFDSLDNKVEIISDYITNETSNEFQNKARILLIYAKLDKALDVSEELKNLDLKDTILNDKGQFDGQKFEYNSDTFFWMIISLIKAHMTQNKEAINGLVDAMSKYYDYINNDLVTSLFFNVHYILNNEENKNINFLKDLWNGNYPSGMTYDKRLIGFYKYIAISILAYINEPLADEMITDLNNFATMKAGKICLSDLGIFDKYYLKDEDDVFVSDMDKEDTEKASSQDVIEETSEEIEKEDN